MSVLLGSWDHAYISSCHFSLGVEEAHARSVLRGAVGIKERGTKSSRSLNVTMFIVIPMALWRQDLSLWVFFSFKMVKNRAFSSVLFYSLVAEG